MEAHPKVGDTVAQENATVAQDMATVLSNQKNVTVPFGSFHHVLETKEFSPLEPGALEHKFYVRGVGLVETVDVLGGTGGIELVDVIRG
jgi:hypothetical protein